MDAESEESLWCKEEVVRTYQAVLRATDPIKVKLKKTGRICVVFPSEIVGARPALNSGQSGLSGYQASGNVLEKPSFLRIESLGKYLFVENLQDDNHDRELLKIYVSCKEEIYSISLWNDDSLGTSDPEIWDLVQPKATKSRR
jgi:hypothetical protein